MREYISSAEEPWTANLSTAAIAFACKASISGTKLAKRGDIEPRVSRIVEDKILPSRHLISWALPPDESELRKLELTYQ